MKNLFTLFLMTLLSLNLYALPEEKFTDREYKKFEAAAPQPQFINWEGYIVSDGNHTTRHDHKLKFIQKADGKSFDITKSPELEKTHCKFSKILWVKMVAKQTEKILFWGGDLVVKKFVVIKKLNSLPHNKWESQNLRSSLNRR